MAVDDAYSKVLLHFNGADGSTTFTDESGKTWTRYSDAHIVTDYYKWTSSGLFAASLNSTISTPDSADFNFDADFTIDFWFRHTTIENWSGIISANYATGDSWRFYCYSNRVHFAYAGAFDAEFAQTLSVGTWYHFALVRYGTSVKGYIDGVEKCSGTLSGAVNSGGHGVKIGGLYTAAAGSNCNGRMEELRISKGIARWTAAFTPPTSEYIVNYYYETVDETLTLQDTNSATGNFSELIDDGLALLDGVPQYFSETVDETIDFADDTDYSLNVTLLSVSDSMDMGDEMYITWPLDISEGLDLSEDVIRFWDQSVSDNLFSGDDIYAVWAVTVLEGMDLSEDVIMAFSLLISSNLFSYDNAYVGWGLSAMSELSLVDTVDVILGLIISEWLTLIDTESDNWNGREIVDDTFEGYDESLAYKIFSDTLSDAVDLADSPTYQLIIEVLEYLWFNDLATVATTFAQSVADTVNLADGVERSFPLSVESLLSAIDLSTVSGMFLNQIAESIDFADVSDAVNRIGVSVTDPLVFAETITNQGEFYTAVYDTLQLNTLVELAGDVYECYVLNTPKFFPSMYSGFDFNSYAVFENRAFGANDTGIFELTGDNDAGSTIHTGVIMPNTDFGAPNQKRFRRGYFGITGSTPLMILETEQGERQAYSIEMVKGKAVSSHELKSKKWILSVADFESIDSIKLIPVILTK